MSFIKRVISQTADLAMIIKKSRSDRQSCTKSNKKYFCCGKKKHYTKNCCLKQKKKLLKEEKIGKKAK